MFKKTNGAVSVFLVMILVPCIVVSSIFVDLGRVHLSKNISNSASDLALNSLMTNYDYDLTDWYGMAASCQNIEEFYEGSAQYFLRMLSSRGMSKEEITLLSDYYTQVTGDETIYDLLKVESKESKIAPVKNANMTNPTIIKDQMVEFMKYRGPITLVENLIDRLKNDKSTESAEEYEKNSELVEKKQEYFEDEGELLEKAYNTYKSLNAYNNLNLTNEKLQEYTQKLNECRTIYKDAHNLMVSNLFNTSGLGVFTRTTYKIDKYKYQMSDDGIYSRKEDEQYFIDGEKLSDTFSKLRTNIDAFNAAKANIINAAGGLANSTIGVGASDISAIQWWVQINGAVNNSLKTKYAKAAEKMLDTYARLDAMQKCVPGNNLPDRWQETQMSLLQEVKDIQFKYLRQRQWDANDAYLKIVTYWEDVSSNNLNNINSDYVTISAFGGYSTINNAVIYVSDSLGGIRAELQKNIDALNVVLNGDGGDTVSLDKLLKLVEKYHDSYNKWDKTSGTVNTQMGENDKVEIHGGINSDGEKKEGIEQNCKEITYETITELRTRINNIIGQIKNVMNGIDSMTYGTTKIVDIRGYNAFKSCASNAVSSGGIPLVNGEISNYANSTFNSLFKPNADLNQPILSLEHLGDNNYNPNIDPKLEKEVNSPRIYVHFYKRFGQVEEGSLKKGKKDVQTLKNLKKKKSDEKDKGRYHGGGSDIKREFSPDIKFKLASGLLKGVTETVSNLIKGNLTSMRDDLLSTAYVMEMFSYATFENQGLFNLCQDKNALTLGNHTEEYKKLMGAADKEKTWLSTKPTDQFNKTLTNKMINKENNFAYGAEVEYILFGGENEKNVKNAYGDIYAIRYPLNLVSGFQHFWGMSNQTGGAINGIAQSIQLATSGIVPSPLTKTILISLLAVFETSNDMNRLEAGFPLEMYKAKDDDWCISLDGLVGVAADNVEGALTPKEKKLDKGLFYSDYLTLFVYLGFNNGETASALYQRTAEVMQSNMRKATKNKQYSFSKSIVYFQLNATIKVEPLMITLPIFNDYENNLGKKTDWCTYKIKTMRGYS